jgi:cellulose synthase/poly-beta-1,6-N-acetylglucosamine synthase-like glycosyltransferase
MIVDSIIKIIFWFSLFLVFWTYFGYLLTLKTISISRRKKVRKGADFPDVSLIVTAFNEESNIRQKIENCFSLAYPREKLEIIVVSDGSTDGTNDIVRSFSDRGIILLAQPERQGKHFGQGHGIKTAKNEILVFSDATTYLRSDAIENIVKNFADPEIGCVSGQDEIRSSGSASQGEGFYVKYEMKLRTLESRANSLVGVSGSFFAVRKHLCREWIGNLSSDFYLPIITYMNGYRTVLENAAIGYYEILDDPGHEFVRKVRTIVHGMEVLSRFKDILNPLKYGFFSLQMISHKLSRWLVPLYLVFLFWANLLLMDSAVIFRSAWFVRLFFICSPWRATWYRDGRGILFSRYRCFLSWLITRLSRPGTTSFWEKNS